MHIRSHQHHPTPYSENMVTSARKDVPDVACILTASKVASRGSIRIPKGHPMANTPRKFSRLEPKAMEVDGRFGLRFQLCDCFFASSPSFSRGCAFDIFQFVWAIFWFQVWEVMSADALLCSDARSLFSASW